MNLINTITGETVMKSIMALAASTLIVTSAFMQPATAQTKRTGNGYSQMGENETSVDIQFNLVDKDRDGNLIKDIKQSGTETDNFVGFFPRAIEDYKGGGGLAIACLKFDIEPICTSGLVNGRYVFDNSGFLIIKEKFDTSSIIPVDGDLKAELIVNDPLFPDNTNSIAYTIFKTGENVPLQSYRLDLSAFVGFDQDKAINDLSYILEQNLLSKVRTFSTFDENKLGIGDVLLQNNFEEDIKNIPESQATTGLLLLGFLGAVFLLKHQIRNLTD